MWGKIFHLISVKEASASLEAALFGVFRYQLITIFENFDFLQYGWLGHLTKEDQLQDLGGRIAAHPKSFRT